MRMIVIGRDWHQTLKLSSRSGMNATNSKSSHAPDRASNPTETTQTQRALQYEGVSVGESKGRSLRMKKRARGDVKLVDLGIFRGKAA